MNKVVNTCSSGVKAKRYYVFAVLSPGRKSAYMHVQATYAYAHSFLSAFAPALALVQALNLFHGPGLKTRTQCMAPRPGSGLSRGGVCLAG